MEEWAMSERMTAPSRDKVRCGFCRYFAPNHLECRAAPPRVFMNRENSGVYPDPVPRWVTRSVFPSVKPSHWCGAFEFDAEKDTEAGS